MRARNGSNIFYQPLTGWDFDATVCVVWASFLQIETLLQRNHLPHRIAVEQIYRLQHGLMTSSSQQASCQFIIIYGCEINVLMNALMR